MSVASIKAQIKTQMESLSTVGKVNDFRRYNIEWDDIVNNFIEDDIVNGWWIEWVSCEQDWTQITGCVIKQHTFRVWGIYGLKDSAESAKTFEDIVEDVLDELTTSRTLSNEAYINYPPKLLDIDDAFFAGMLVHRCQIILSIKEKREI